MKTFYQPRINNNESNEGGFKNRNFILKQDANKVWPLYALSGKTSIKPYPSFDNNGVPCPSRMPSQFESDGNVPDAEALTKEEITQYRDEVIPPNFVGVPVVTWVGKEGVQFIDYCSDIADYANDEEQQAGALPLTPYGTMVRTLMKLVPTDKYKGVPNCPPTLKRCRGMGQNILSLRYPQQAILFRGALIKHKSKPMETKSSVDGVLYRATLLVSQRSAVLALKGAFFEKKDNKRPIGADNFMLTDMFNPEGEFLTFVKVDPNQSQSDYQVKTEYDESFNQALIGYTGATSPEHYYRSVCDAMGAFQTTESMLNIMTVQEQLALIVDQFPASWVWYGLRDSRYGQMVEAQVKEQALRDPEWFELFGITPVVATNSSDDKVPMGGFGQPKVPTTNTGFKGFPKTAGFAAAQDAMKDAEVTYQPRTEIKDKAAASLFEKYGVKH